MKMIRCITATAFALALVFSSHNASAQVEIGVKISPSLAFSRTIAQDKYKFDGEGAKPGFGIGVIADYFFGANYAVSSGLIYNIKGGNVAYNYSYPDPASVGGTITKSGKDELSLQYLEIPVALKLFTNEITPETRFYFQAGTSLNTMLNAKVNEKKVDPDGDKYTKRFNTFEIDVLIGIGAERNLGQSTKLFGGITYHRGLTDADDSYYSDLFGDDKVELKNNSFSLDLGIKF
ncbi:outer membrane beta-barrel protein [Nibribacter ruber]|uniref:Outer membrane beta-barrel protein n=1 Tax=Nibribacter ruber TaxID=2698458 RepID=A0A6P1NZV3_9BACT|nr:porin family protein [Nibribacter ruber]QHL87765.1 outer membrane beta-barrel protein [Nibribacter ruber]